MVSATSAVCDGWDGMVHESHEFFLRQRRQDLIPWNQNTDTVRISLTDATLDPRSNSVEPDPASYPRLCLHPDSAYDVPHGLNSSFQPSADAYSAQPRKRRKLSVKQPAKRSSGLHPSSAVMGLRRTQDDGTESAGYVAERPPDFSNSALSPVGALEESSHQTWSLSSLGSLMYPCCAAIFEQNAGPYVAEKMPTAHQNAQPVHGSQLAETPVIPYYPYHDPTSHLPVQAANTGGNTPATGPHVGEASMGHHTSLASLEFGSESDAYSKTVPQDAQPPASRQARVRDSKSSPDQPPPEGSDISGMSSFHVNDDKQPFVPQPPQYSSAEPLMTMAQDNHGKAIQYTLQPNFYILQPNQRGGKRGPFKDPVLREQTARTRKMGSCVRCRMQRIRCEHNANDPLGPCLTCKKLENTRAGRLPCLRYKISDVRLYKPGQVPGFEWTKRWTHSGPDPVQKWMSSDIKTVHISDGYSDRTLKIQVRKFVPEEGDKLTRTWSYNGVVKCVEIPPYALIDFADATRAYAAHIHGSMNQAFPNVLGNPANLLYRTYKQMLDICKDCSTPRESAELLRDTFRLWMSIRLSTRSCFIVGEETLGIPEDILDETSPTPGKIPVPPVLGAQLDLILIHDIQAKLRRRLLERLEKLVSKRKLNTWMVTYLVIFVLLHNTALITAHDAGYARKHGMKRRFAREDKVKEYHLDQELQVLAGLDESQIQFIHATRSSVRRQRGEWEQVRAKGDYEDDYYFVSQLFEEQWHPGTTI
ncbi:hypothetical protein GMORB2_5675 [Geosmithia morbida]|uniref:Zn(2)-C6 fungal-type domain-containing protein n=1 Tax=Geosmithia morbida TaxID=1094350 RepID=A0A9P4YZN2_9HYPO|nr:uncharacterized protein GMORB2_5675 [Geosmithia morbida]KAF4123959.1 hypothetical protein GMORB2_5675 [Geosmithia morbida]